MDLMTLAAKITLDDSSYTKGISNAESMGQKLQGKMSAMTVAVGNLAADMIKKSINGVQQIIGGAIDGYADYQQLIGGVETLFKTSSNRVADYAKKSFKTTGLSANQYMETVTSFSASLLQGLGGDTEAAADLANTAVTDMADNANKMGTDISSIQAAYQGFAKQNYTMLDNLKLGYGGTQSEMIRLINDSRILDHQISDLDGITFDQMISAIHEIQTQMGITGTTAKEAAETISGSKASMKAAWEDLLAAIGGAGTQNDLDRALENFKTSFSGYMDNFAPTLVQTIAGSGDLVTAIADAIGNLPTTLLSQVGESATEAGTGMVKGLTNVTGWLIDSITEMFHSAAMDNTSVVELGAAIGDFLGTAISKIATNAGTIFEGIVSVGAGLASGLVEGLIDGLFGQGAYGEITEAEKEANASMLKAMENNTKAQGILNYMQDLVDKYGKAAENTQEWKQAVDELNAVMPGANEWLDNQQNSLGTAIKNMKEYSNELEKLAIQEAKRKALEVKQEALTNAQAAVYAAKGEIMIKEKESTYAQQQMIDFIRNNGNANFTGQGMSWDQIRDYAYSYLNEKIGPGNEGYKEAQRSLDSWSSTMETSESRINELNSSLPELEKQLEFAKMSYLTSSAAIDELAGAASGAAFVLQALETPSVTYDSGTYYNWYYGNKHAKGAWSVPYDDYPALLHRGERVLTASQARQDSGTVMDYSKMNDVIESAIERGMEKARIELLLDGRAITHRVSKDMTNAIKAAKFRG